MARPAPTTHRRATERLILRPYEPEDVHDYAELQTDPEVVRFIPNWPVRTPEESAAHFQRRLKQNMIRGAGDFLAFAVELQGKVIGDVSIFLRSPERAEVGYLLNRAYWGQGYAEEAMRELLAFAQEHDLPTCAVIHPENHASRRLASKLRLPEILED